VTQQFSPLPLVIPATDDALHALLNHLLVTKAKYRNIHLREFDKKADKLLHLHAIYADSDYLLSGMAAGPGFFVRYAVSFTAPANAAITKPTIQTQAGVIGTPQALAAFAANFEKRVLARIEMDNEEGEHYPRYKKGAFYLRRSKPGSLPSSPGCKNAVSSGVLPPAFVSVLSSWNLQLINP
jgi:hypothetical protein